jgi:hypothetical protein
VAGTSIRLGRPPLAATTALAAAGAVALSAWLATSAVASASALEHRAAPAAIGLLMLWLFLSERYTLTLSVFLIYLGLFDGVVKLTTNSSVATLGRDALLYAITLGAIARLIVRRTAVTVPPLALGVIAWLLIAVAQIFNPADLSIGHAVASIRQHIEFVPLFFFGYALMRKERRFTVFFALLIVVAAINAIVALIQTHLTPAQLASWGPGYAGLVNGTATISSRLFVVNGVAHIRPPALGSDFGFAGGLAVLALPCALAMIADTRRIGRLAAVAWIGLPFLILGVVTSEARSDVVSSVIVVLTLALLTIDARRGLAVLATLLVAGAVTFAIVGQLQGSTATSANRYSSIAPTKVISTTLDYRSSTLALIPKYAVRYPLGAGMGSVGPAGGSSVGGATTNELDAESEFTFLEIELGLPGLLVMLALTIGGIVLGVRLRRLADPQIQRPLMVLTAVLIALLASWIIGIVSASTPPAPFFWFATGVIAYWYRELRSGRAREKPRVVRAALAGR